MIGRKDRLGWIAIAFALATAATRAAGAEGARPATCPAGAPADAFAIGQLYDSGISVPQDFAIAAACYLAAAMAGNRAAQFNIAAMYDNGRGVPRDLAIASEWYRKSAEQGDGRAAYALGLIYREQGDRRAALAWFRAAERAGIAAAKQKIAALAPPPTTIAREPGLEEYRHGLAALRGDGEPRDSAAAFQWFNRGASAGGDLAAYALAALYERGEGVAPDDQMASAWYGVAAREFPAGGRPRAAAEEGVARTAARLTPAQRDAAAAETRRILATLDRERPIPPPSSGSTRR
jgi:TPR repeat protein